MSTLVTVPINERSSRLKDHLANQAKLIAAILSSHPGLVPETASPYLFLIFPWIASASDQSQIAVFADRRKAFEAAGFDGTSVLGTLNQILSEDQHLKECCAGTIQAARCFDLNYIISAVWAIRLNASQFNPDSHFEQFESTIYGAGRFKALSLCHIFNFKSDDAGIKFGDIWVERLDGPTTSKIIGETSPVSFIHPPGTGEYFVISETGAPCDDHIKWLIDEKNKAELFLHVLQYFKDGVVHIDYAVPYFLPEWVNQVRKWGIFFIGNPRRVPYQNGQKPYLIVKSEQEPIARWWKAYQKPEIFARISDLQHPMRQAGLRAAEYFELSHTQEKPSDRLISLAIALESLFSPNDQGELTFRMSQSLSQLIGTTEAGRLELFKVVKKFYSKRSKLIHGQYDVKAFLEGRWVTHDECDAWASLIRQAIMRILVLYLRGQNSRDDFLTELSESSLDAAKAETLRAKSDVETFLAEQS
jgi:hypothetical protein